MIGKVKWFNNKKGFGFILPEGASEADDGNDIFVHFSSIQAEENSFRTLYHGEKVEFTIVNGDKGQEAKDVNVLEPSPRRVKSIVSVNGI